MRSAQGDVVWIKPSGSQSTAVAATSDEPMDVDTASHSQVAVGTDRIYGQPLPNQNSFIQPAQGTYDSGRGLSLAGKSRSRATSTIIQRSAARSRIQPAAGTFRKRDSAMQWSGVPVTSPSVLGSGVGSKSYISPAQGNFLNEGSTRPDTSLGQQLPNPMLNPGINPGGVLGNKETKLGKDMVSVTYACLKAPGTPGPQLPSLRPSCTSITTATTQGMDMEGGPYSRMTTGLPGLPPPGGSKANPGPLVPTVHPRQTPVAQATARTPSTKRPLTDVLSEDECLGSKPAAKWRRTGHGSRVAAVVCDRTPVAQATARKQSTRRPLRDVLSEDECLGSEPAAKKRRTGHGSLAAAVVRDRTPVAKATARRRPTRRLLRNIP